MDTDFYHKKAQKAQNSKKEPEEKRTKETKMFSFSGKMFEQEAAEEVELFPDSEGLGYLCLPC